MELIKEINHKTQLSSRYNEMLVSLRSHSTMSKFKSIFLVVSSVFTTLLISQTLEIQHSCQPMFHSGTLPAKCLIVTQADSNPSHKKILNLPKEASQNVQKHKIDNTSEDSEIKISKTPIPSVTKKQADSLSQSVNEHNDDRVGEVAKIKTSIPSAIKKQANSAGQFVNKHSHDVIEGVEEMATGAATLTNDIVEGIAKRASPISSAIKKQANSTGQFVNKHSHDVIEGVEEIATGAATLTNDIVEGMAKRTSPISSAIKNQANSAGQFVNEHSDDIVGGTAGIAAGAATLAAAGVTASMSVPVVVAVAIGLGIWLGIKSFL